MSQSSLLGETVTSTVGTLRLKTYHAIFLYSKYSSCITTDISAFYYMATPRSTQLPSITFNLKKCQMENFLKLKIQI